MDLDKFKALPNGYYLATICGGLPELIRKTEDDSFDVVGDSHGFIYEDLGIISEVYISPSCNRLEKIATAAMQALISQHGYISIENDSTVKNCHLQVAAAAVGYTHALIAELDKQEK